MQLVCDHFTLWFDDQCFLNHFIMHLFILRLKVCLWFGESKCTAKINEGLIKCCKLHWLRDSLNYSKNNILTVNAQMLNGHFTLFWWSNATTNNSFMLHFHILRLKSICNKSKAKINYEDMIKCCILLIIYLIVKLRDNCY